LIYAFGVSVPQIGERYRGVDGRTGYLLRQAWHEFRGAMEVSLREQGLNAAQYAVMTVLARDPAISSADLARGCNISPQAMNGVVMTLERAGIVERHPHPTHGRILQVTLTDEGERRLAAARPAVDRLEGLVDKGYSDEQLALIHEWLVTAAQRMVAEATDAGRT
jgi:DNA-binding MarR family transcriptional regulator